MPVSEGTGFWRVGENSEWSGTILKTIIILTTFIFSWRHIESTRMPPESIGCHRGSRALIQIDNFPQAVWRRTFGRWGIEEIMVSNDWVLPQIKAGSQIIFWTKHKIRETKKYVLGNLILAFCRHMNSFLMDVYSQSLLHSGPTCYFSWRIAELVRNIRSFSHWSSPDRGYHGPEYNDRCIGKSAYSCSGFIFNVSMSINIIYWNSIRLCKFEELLE